MGGIKDHEHWKGDTFPRIYSNLQVGDELLKGHKLTGSDSCYLRIDSTDIVDDVPELHRGIHYIVDLFTERAGSGAYESRGGKVKLSDLIGKNMGDCLEMAVVVQLKAQIEGRKSFLISSSIYGGELEFAEDHSFNIVRGSKGDYLLVDVARYFTSKINAIDASDEGDLTIDTEREVNVTYCIN